MAVVINNVSIDVGGKGEEFFEIPMKESAPPPVLVPADEVVELDLLLKEVGKVLNIVRSIIDV